MLPTLAAALALAACAPGPRAGRSDSYPAPPTEADLSERPSLAAPWADRLRSPDPQTSADAAQALVDAHARSLPLLARLTHSRDERTRAQAIDVLHRIGPDAIPLLAEMLVDPRVTDRRVAIDLLVDLAPDTESIQPHLQKALRDEDVEVARDAARALGALRERAAPSTAALVEAVSDPDAHVRTYAAEALASIGRSAATAAVPALVAALGDGDPAVRWAACEALAAFGPAAAPAVPALGRALKDDFLYVRLCAANALGSIGPAAAGALPVLTDATNDPTLRAEARWAIDRISGSAPAREATATPPLQPVAPLSTASQPPPVGPAIPPLDWNIDTGRNVAWSVPLGGDAFGRPVVTGGVVYVGTDNALKRDARFTDACGVLAAFRASDGTFLWQDVAPRVDRGLGEFLLPSTTSAPLIEGDRLYYVTAECQLRCLDIRGDSPRRLWQLDMAAQLGVFPHESSNSDVVAVGDLVVVCTSNGQNQGHTRVPSPRAPGLIAVDKRTGEVAWKAIGAGEGILHGQWCSPVAINVNGETQILFGGGDGWLRGYDAGSGAELWRFDGNLKDARYLPRPGVLSRSPIVAPPVYAAGRVFVAMGDDPSHGDGPSLLHAIRPIGRGDVTAAAEHLWISRDIGRVVGSPVIDEAAGLLYVGDLGGRVTCLDAATGELAWQHDTDAPIWGCLFLAAGRLYAGNTDGTMTVLRAGRQKEVLAIMEMDSPLYSRPEAISNDLYIATARRLYRVNSAVTPAARMR